MVSVVPSHARARGVGPSGADLLRPDALVVSASKGIEVGTGKLCSDVLMEILPASVARPALLPVGAELRARDRRAAARPRSRSPRRNENYAVAAQALISSPQFRCYTNSDVVGVELGGALKNVIAIAVGVADGMESGLNSRAALITRGLAEMTRLGVALGANPVTFLGLVGRRRPGAHLHGRSVAQPARRARDRPGQEGRARCSPGCTQVAEGVRTAKSAYELAQKHGVDMPITTGVYLMLFEGKNPVRGRACSCARASSRARSSSG